MAEQHAYRTNLLISSNRVQLIPLAASSADYQLRAPGVRRNRKKSAAPLFFCPKSRGFKRWVMNEEVVRALSQPLWRKRLRRDEGISWEEDIGREDTETQRYKVYEFGKISHCRTKKNCISGSEFWFPKCITLTISSCIEFSTMDRGQTKKDSRSLKQEANNTCHVPQHIISLPLQDTWTWKLSMLLIQFKFSKTMQNVNLHNFNQENDKTSTFLLPAQSHPIPEECVLAVLLQIHTLLRKPVQTYCMEW